MILMVHIQKARAPEELELISTLASGDPHEHVIFIIGLMAVAERSLMQVIGLASGCSSSQTVSQFRHALWGICLIPQMLISNLNCLST